MDNILYITLFGFHYINSKHILKSLTTKVFDQLFKTLSAVYLFLQILKPTILWNILTVKDVCVLFYKNEWHLLHF